jgi:hypothetical protein
MRRVTLAIVIDLGDSSMGEGTCVPGLGAEPGEGLRVLAVLLPQQLDRHRAFQHDIGSRQTSPTPPTEIRLSSR